VGSIWKAYYDKDFTKARRLADVCYEEVKEEAMQTQFRLSKQQLAEIRERELFKNWALNDAAECLYIKAVSYEFEGNIKQAQESYQLIVDNFPDAWTGWPGWLWQPAIASKEAISKLDNMK
jgi:hypothetical protein